MPTLCGIHTLGIEDEGARIRHLSIHRNRIINPHRWYPTLPCRSR